MEAAQLMPTLTPRQRTQLAAATAGIAAIIGVSALAFRADEYQERVTAVLEDAGVSRTGPGDRVIDLLTAAVEPGATVTTGVNLPLGSRASDVAVAGMFDVDLVTHTDRVDTTWLEVVARNRTGVPMRFVAFVTYSISPDGGL
jgi:hypothetical protein